MGNRFSSLKAWVRICGCAWALFICNQSHAVQPLLGVQEIAVGWGHACAIVNGGAQCWGSNINGQLGNGDAFNRDSGAPTKVKGLGVGVTAIAAGGAHACAIVNGGVQCWGNNWFGQLGSAAPASYSTTPVAVPELSSGVTAISAGSFHTCAIVNGGAQCWGRNQASELGDGTTTDSNVPVPVIGLSSGVTAIAAANNLAGTAIQYFFGFEHTCAVVNGGVKCWGDDTYGQLGDGQNTSQSTPVAVTGLSSGVTAIASGGLHSCAIANSAVKCWGRNLDGQLGNGATADSNTPVAVAALGSVATAIMAGTNHSCGIADGHIRCWGNNQRGQLGNGSIASASTPVDVAFLGVASVGKLAAGGDHTCARVVTGSGVTQMECWGQNESGDLGLGTVLQHSQPNTVTGLASGVTTVGTGVYGLHSCAVVNGAAKCWGLNSYGQLGDGGTLDTSFPIAVTGMNSGVTMIATGYLHTCAVANGAVQCWGQNDTGQLGDGTTAASSTPVAVVGLSSNVTSVAAGYGHTCAIVAGALECWGYDPDGELGDGSSVYFSPTPVMPVGMSSGVTGVAAGVTHTCAVLNGGAHCWGQNTSGELGNGTTSDSAVPVAVTGLASNVTTIAAGNEFSCAIVNQGVQCWGYRALGQLGDGIALPPLSTTAVTASGLTSGVTSLAVGSHHACAVVNAGVECWGDGAQGQLGSDTSRSLVPIPVPALSSGVIAVSAGNTHTCALLLTGEEKCWGDDHYGQLGDAHFLVAETPQIVVAGDAIFAGDFE